LGENSLFFEGDHNRHTPAHTRIDFINLNAGSVGDIAALFDEEIIDRVDGVG
jgi:hypothetical protein